jgi:hypothetical protein
MTHMSKRIRRSLVVTFFVVAVAMTTTTCGTLVRVVDDHGAPVAGAQVQVIYPSIDGSAEATDADGNVRLRDTWRDRVQAPKWVWVSTNRGRWQFDYPPPAVLRLDPKKRL